MRLDIVENGHRRFQRFVLRIMERLAGRETLAPVYIMSYRSEFCGKDIARCLQESMRGAKEWSKGETELFAAFVSRVNQCPY